ncbi:hypothetical protein Hte_000947 [Hypoxylon texense]
MPPSDWEYYNYPSQRAAGRRKREASATRAMQAYTYPSPQASPLVPETRQRIDLDVPLALVPGRGHGVSGGWQYSREEETWLDVPGRSDLSPSSDSQPISPAYYSSVSLGPYEDTVVLHSRGKDDKDKSYASWKSYPTLDSTSTTTQAASSQTILTRPATPVWRYSDQANEPGNLTGEYIPRFSTPPIYGSEDNPYTVGGSGAWKSEVGNIDIGNRGTFTPSPISKLGDPTYQVSEFGIDERPSGTPLSVSPISKFGDSTYEVSIFSQSDNEDRPRWTLSPSPTSRVGDSSYRY